ncbi:MAG: phosphoribosylglycinamide formyltransferase [Thermoplasmata archaeon]|nr:phosphoribosylglycinamide formyltransferase [Thermoplasmata archaeon]
MTDPLRVAVLVSGEGTTLEGLANAFARGEANAAIVLVVSDRAETPALERARRLGLEVHVATRAGLDPETWSATLSTLLRNRAVDLVVLAGFRSILPSQFLAAFRGRVINIHPSLLPRHGGRGMYGARVHRAVLESQEVETGATVHLVTGEVDAGPILWQERVLVGDADTADSLRERVRPAELRSLIRVIHDFAAHSVPLPHPLAEG